MSEGKGRILLAESDSDMLFMLNKVLISEGYDVECYNVGSAIVELKYKLPDVFIIDRELHEIDGIGVSKFLRIQNPTKQTPIILLSNTPIKRAKEFGINEVIIKPFHLGQLLEALEKNISSNISAVSHNSTSKTSN